MPAAITLPRIMHIGADASALLADTLTDLGLTRRSLSPTGSFCGWSRWNGC